MPEHRPTPASVPPLKARGNVPSLKDFQEGSTAHQITRARRKADEVCSSARVALRAAQQALEIAETNRAYLKYMEMVAQEVPFIHWRADQDQARLTGCGEDVANTTSSYKTVQANCPLCRISTEFPATPE